jgi:hypothetical protein
MAGRWLRKPNSDASVVFVHGILSSGQTCWTNANGAYWPDLLAQERGLGNLGIYIFSYRTDIFSGGYQLGDAVDSLKENLRLDEVVGSKRLIFVCHSMGGIVVRQFFVVEQSLLIEKKRSLALFLVASPSLGSEYANWFRLLAKALGNRQADALRFHRNNAWLNDLDKNFRNLRDSGRLSIHGKELIEDNFLDRLWLKLFWHKPIVEYFSGARYFADSYKVPYSDHESIAKPVGSGAEQHRLLVRFIEDFLENTGTAKDDPLSGDDTWSGTEELFELARPRTDQPVAAPASIEIPHPHVTPIEDRFHDTRVGDTSEPVKIGEAVVSLEKDVFFTGAEGSGKTTALNAFLVKSSQLGKKTVLIHFLEYDKELRISAAFWHLIADSVYNKFKGYARLDAPSQITLPRELTRYLFDKVIPIVYPLVIAFDEVGRLRHKPIENQFYEMIRVWRELDNNAYGAKNRLRIVLCGLERLRELSAQDEDDKGSRTVRIEDIHLKR